MYQHIVIVGNVGREPKMRRMPSGDPVTDFSVAVNRRWNNRDGQPQEKTTWFRVSVFGRQAEVVNQYVTKGRQVLVEGEVEASAYIAQDGTPRASLDLRARNVRFMGARGEGGAPDDDEGSFVVEDGSPNGGEKGHLPPAPTPSVTPEQKGPVDEDEIPF